MGIQIPHRYQDDTGQGEVVCRETFDVAASLNLSPCNEWYWFPPGVEVYVRSLWKLNGETSSRDEFDNQGLIKVLSAYKCPRLPRNFKFLEWVKWQPYHHGIGKIIDEWVGHLIPKKGRVAMKNNKE